MKLIGSLINRKPKDPDCSYDEAESLLPSCSQIWFVSRDYSSGFNVEFILKDLRRAGRINAEQLREPSHQMPPPTNDKNLVVTDFC